NYFSTDVIGSKNHAIQSIVDLAVLTQIIENDGLEAVIDDETATDWLTSGDSGDIGYAGLSLGGFVGFPFTTVEPAVNTSVFGGKLVRVLLEGNLGGALVSALEQAGLAAGTFARYRAVAFLEWLGDPVDPFSFSPFITESPLFEPAEKLRNVTFEPDSGFSTGSLLPPNDVLMQMSESPDTMDDPIVPNALTELLANAIGITSNQLDVSTFTGPHGLPFVTDDSKDSFEAAECARGQAAAWLANGLTGDQDLTIPDSIPAQLRSSNCP
ncbi:MAG: hypothetical protein ABEK29_06900, partial [Bradymonadaceae bacterium]